MKTLRELRKKEGITMKALGQIIGVAESTVSQYETGKREPDNETLKKLADHFNVSVDYLLGRDETAQKNPTPVSGDGIDVSADDLQHLAAFHAADENTKAAIRLLLSQYKEEQE